MCAYEQNIVIDLEFNPTPRKTSAGLRFEIIEIGAMKVDAEGVVEDEFSCLVKPCYSQFVRKNIIALTGIKTCDVSQAPTLEEALDNFTRWIGDKPSRIVAWSKNDQRQIKQECAHKGIEIPRQLRRWLDLQAVYPRIMNVGNGRLMRLSTAADWYGAEIDQSSAHRALYDAKVTAALLSQLLTGAYRQQKDALAAVLANEEEPSTRLSSSLGDACAGLAALKQQLLANDGAAAAA